MKVHILRMANLINCYLPCFGGLCSGSLLLGMQTGCTLPSPGWSMRLCYIMLQCQWDVAVQTETLGEKQPRTHRWRPSGICFLASMCVMWDMPLSHDIAIGHHLGDSCMGLCGCTGSLMQSPLLKYEHGALILISDTCLFKTVQQSPERELCKSCELRISCT